VTVVVALLLVFCVAVFIAQPLLTTPPEGAGDTETGPPELWSREKGVALLAIREAEFDHATGKLTEDDYEILRNAYEERALHAMRELDRNQPSRTAAASVAASSAVRFCRSCGRQFSEADRFCGGCGEPRSRPVTPAAG
jgi:hypothetical protein